MRKLQLTIIIAVLLASAPSLAQEGMTTSQHGQLTDLSVLPQGCRDAIQQSGMPEMMKGMDMSGKMKGMKDMDEAQQASMRAMMEMNIPMMATHTIKDPDLAFHCGMIAHHAGAIAMAKVELQYGDDEQSKAMAQQIIDAQGPEIEEMTAWVKANTSQ